MNARRSDVNKGFNVGLPERTFERSLCGFRIVKSGEPRLHWVSKQDAKSPLTQEQMTPAKE
jgi:hypothetical protein